MFVVHNKKSSEIAVGLGFREQFRSDLFLCRNEIDFLEITADHYLDATPKKLQELDLLAEHFPLVPHALNLSLGSAEGIDNQYLDKLAALLEKVKPAWWSEHICFTRSGGVEIGHLAPLPYTSEALEILVKNIKKVKTVVEVPLILENITSMIQLESVEMDEADFVRKVVETADCGILLDITNLYINSKNHNYDWREYLDKLPLERIVQLHFVGFDKYENWYIDAHADKTPDEIWMVFAEVCRRTKNLKGAILERDENFPPFSLVLEELNTARRIIEQCR